MKMISQRVIRGVRHPKTVGMLVAVRAEQGTPVYIGYSKCRLTRVSGKGPKVDRYNSELGHALAMGRAVGMMNGCDSVKNLVLPSSMQDEVIDFICRSYDYFKTNDIHVVGFTISKENIESYYKEWQEDTNQKIAAA